MNNSLIASVQTKLFLAIDLHSPVIVSMVSNKTTSLVCYMDNGRYKRLWPLYSHIKSGDDVCLLSLCEMDDSIIAAQAVICIKWSEVKYLEYSLHYDRTLIKVDDLIFNFVNS